MFYYFVGDMRGCQPCFNNTTLLFAPAFIPTHPSAPNLFSMSQILVSAGRQPVLNYACLVKFVLKFFLSRKGCNFGLLISSLQAFSAPRGFIFFLKTASILSNPKYFSACILTICCYGGSRWGTCEISPEYKFPH